MKELTAACADLADQALHDIPGADARLQPLLESLQKLGAQAALMDGPLQRARCRSRICLTRFPKNACCAKCACRAGHNSGGKLI